MATATLPDDVARIGPDAESDDSCRDTTPFLGDPLGRPPDAERGRVVWAYVIAFVAFHLALLLAFVPWFFSWTGLLLIPIGNYVFCSLGIGAGYHRLLTHRSFRCPRAVERTLALLGVCTLMEGPARWVMTHRIHHQNSDHTPDPHSPLVNFFWGHVGWLLVENRQLSRISTYERYARDLLQDPFYFRLERNFLWAWIYLGHAVLFFLIGTLAGRALTGDWSGGLQFGLSVLLYGVIFRTIYSWHITWGVNSLSHLWGYRNYETNENSRNNWLIGLTTNGEGWHNNHHADPRSAVHGFARWWELDVTYLSLCLMQRLGLVHELVPRRRLAD
jgi:stearoyl-CoA desaturase (delta-9 desaturase)